jgi:hypothetical protein
MSFPGRSTSEHGRVTLSRLVLCILVAHEMR